MNGHGQSDGPVVPANPPNKAVAAEVGEERGPALRLVGRLLGGLAAAQRHLASAVADVPDGELARAGCDESGGAVPLPDIFAFLPRHQADHADQLELVG